MIPKINQKTRQWAGKLFAVLFIMLLASSLMTTQTFAQDVPDAGTQIGNQATATFTDANGNDRTVTSNVVNTVVQQVAGVTVQADLTKQVSPGGQVAFPFTITNDGNGDDTFTLTTNQQGGDDFNLTNLQVFADANGDGNPDNFTDLTGSNTPSLAPDEVFNVVVVGEVPNTAASAQQALVDLIGTSVADGTVTDQTTGTATVSENAVVSVSKALSQSTAQPSDQLTVTLTFTNSGNTAASAITIEDPLPANMSYETGTGNWSEGGSLTDTDGASVITI